MAEVANSSIKKGQSSAADELANSLVVGAQMKAAALAELSALAVQGDPHTRYLLSSLATQKMVKIALYAGSFDPFTTGHRDIVERGLHMFDQIIVAVGINSQKGSGLLSKEERIAVIREDLKDLGDRVRVVEFTDASIDVAQREGANFLIRGIRGPTDVPIETDLAQLNREQSNHRIEPVMIVSDPEKAKVSSSKARELICYDLDASSYLTEKTTRLLERKIFGPRLEGHWNSACRALGITDSESVQRKFTEVVDALSAPDRYYHNIVHIWRMLDMFITSGIEVENRDAFLLAIFFHDVVYQVGSTQNEILSAKECSEWLLEMGVSGSVVAQAEEFILATREHSLAGCGKDVALFLDLDLAILSSSDERYDRYASGIRSEYEAVPHRQYCKKRAAFLRGFAEREKIYSNAKDLKISDEKAKANLLREALRLEQLAPKREGPWYRQVNIVTGTIGSGKSSVLQILKDNGAFVVSADDLVKELKSPGASCFKMLLDEFGRGILGPSGEIDNKKLGGLAFSNDLVRNRLNEIFHPAVWELAEKRFEEAEANGEELLIFEVPLFFEAGWDKKGFKNAVVVSTPDAVALERIMARNHLTQEEAEARLASQLPADKKTGMADIIIRNDGSLEELSQRVERVLHILKA